MELIVVKVGGSVITQKASNVPSVNFKNLELVAEQLAAYSKENADTRIIFVHGVGSYGHPIVKQSGIDKGISDSRQLLAFAQTQKLQNELDCIVVGALHKKGIPAMPCQLSDHAIMEKGRIISLDLGAISGMLKIGLVPTCYGVPAYDIAQGCSILSGDQIAPYLARHLKASRIIEACDVGGIYTQDPKTYPDAKLIKEININNRQEIEQGLSGSCAIDVTGGMRQKYLELLSIAKLGIACQIISYQDIRRSLEGEKAGTMISL